MHADPAYRLIDAEEFLAIDFGPDAKAELDRGVIRMMAGGTLSHARIQTNISSYLRFRLRGSGCRPYGPDMAIRIDAHSVRYPDVAVLCGDLTSRANDKLRSIPDAKVIVEILSDSTSAYDQDVKLKEYKTLAGVDTIVFVDPDAERLRVLQRLGPQAWRDESFIEPADLVLPALELTIPHAEIFARD